MSTVAKILVALNLGLAAVFLGSAANFVGQQDNFRGQLEDEKDLRKKDVKNRDDKITELTGRVRLASDQLTAAQNERDTSHAHKQRLEGELKHMKDAFDQLAANLTRAQRSVDSMTTTINNNRALIDSLNADLNKQREALLTVQADRDAKVAMVNQLQIQLQTETQNRKDLEGKVAQKDDENKRLQFRINWYTERYPGVEAVDQPAHEGRVLAADTGTNVYVISLGAEDGVKPGFKYMISRGDDYVATIQIDDVQAKQSAGFAVKDMSKGRIRRGDSVMGSP